MKDQHMELDSKILGRQVPLRLLIPEGEPCRCLFLLHGYGGDRDQWCRQSRIADLAEEFGICVVMPGCGDGYYEDTQENLPAFLGEELVSFAREHLGISGNREDMSVAGVSMGGFGALLIGAKYPRVFGRIACFSGAFIVPDVAIGNPGVLGNADPRYFRQVFGDLQALEGSSRDPLAEALRAKDNLPPVYLLCGNRDVLLRENRNIALRLKEAGVPVIWREMEGGHTWDVWREALPDVLAWLSE